MSRTVWIVWVVLGVAGAARGQSGEGEMSAHVPEGWKVLSATEVERPADGAVMVWIPGGGFLRGSLESEGGDDERPQRRIRIGGFFIDQVEVTWARYARFCEATGRESPQRPDWARDDHPVVNVTWDDASAYTEWAGCVLPREAEWEKAARGTDGRRFPWGDQPWDIALANAYGADDGFPETAPVGSFARGASPYGCLDMAGNVIEWCGDWYDKAYFASSEEEDPAGPTSGTVRVVRGGAWRQDDTFLRSAYRDTARPSVRAVGLGFRCARR